MTKKKTTKTRNTQTSKKSEKQIQPANEVYLVGRITSITGEKKLPSGDLVSEFRIVVDRPGKAGYIDTIDIAAWKSTLRKRIQSLEPEYWVEIKGAVRRRFWQSASGLASRWQVEASEIRRL